MTASKHLLRYALWGLAMQQVAVHAICLPLDSRQSESRDIVQKMAGARPVQGSPLLIRAEVTRRQMRGSAVQEVKRIYRLVQNADRIRIDILPDSTGATRTTLCDRGSDLLLYMQEPKRYYRATRDDPGSAQIQATIANIVHGLNSRWSGLADWEYTAQTPRRSTVTIERNRFRCYRIGVKSKNPIDGEWSGEMWIDEDQFVLRRARLRRIVEGAITEEEVTLNEILTGDSVPVIDLDWAPDAAVQVLKALPHVIPH